MLWVTPFSFSPFPLSTAFLHPERRWCARGGTGQSRRFFRSEHLDVAFFILKNSTIIRHVVQCKIYLRSLPPLWVFHMKLATRGNGSARVRCSSPSDALYPLLSDKPAETFRAWPALGCHRAMCAVIVVCTGWKWGAWEKSFRAGSPEPSTETRSTTGNFSEWRRRGQEEAWQGQAASGGQSPSRVGAR